MASVVVHIRVSRKCLEKIAEGMLRLQLEPPTRLNDLVHIAIQTGVSTMIGPGWESEITDPRAEEIVSSITTQGRAPASATDVLQALQSKTCVMDTDLTTKDPTSIVEEMDFEDQDKATKIWALWVSGHAEPMDSLRNADVPDVRRLSAILLHSFKSCFTTKDQNEITKVYEEVMKCE